MSMKIPQQSMVYLLVCILGILLYVILGIVPLQRSLKELDETIAETRTHLEERKMLTDTRQALKQRKQQQGKGMRPACTWWMSATFNCCPLFTMAWR